MVMKIGEVHEKNESFIYHMGDISYYYCWLIDDNGFYFKIKKRFDVVLIKILTINNLINIDNKKPRQAGF